MGRGGMDCSNATQGSPQRRGFLAPLRHYPDIECGAANASAPLSANQQALWFLCQSRAGNVAYNSSWGWRLKGPLNRAALESALAALVVRQSTLRTTFHFSSSEPVQVVSPWIKGDLQAIDLSPYCETEREQEAQKVLLRQAQAPFDLATGPLFRFQLLRMADDDHILFLTVHHTIVDGSSMGLIGSEISQLYTAVPPGNSGSLPSLPVQYREYAPWYRNLSLAVEENEVNAWRERLRGLADLALPLDHPRPAAPSFRGRTLIWDAEPALANALVALSRRHGVTLFMTMVTAYVALLHRYAGQEDVAVGFFNSGRVRAELRNLVGYFVNTQVLRTDCSGDPSFSALLHRVRDGLLWAYAHNDISFDKLVEAAQPERKPGRNPLFQVLIAEQKMSWKNLLLPDMVATPLTVDNGTSKFDLSLYYQAGGDQLNGWLEYNSDIFEHSTAVQMLQHLKNLMRSAAAEPEAAISRLSILSEAERRQLIVDWNQTESDYTRDGLIHELFEQQVEKSPDATALVCGATRLRYRELNQRANQLAHHLRSRGVSPGDFIGLALNRSPEMLVGLLGILKSGGAYVPLDPGYPSERLAYMIQDAGLKFIVSVEECCKGIASANAELILLDRDMQAIARHSGDDFKVLLASNPLAYVMYTSGSTGKPKGVLAPHRGAINRFTWMWRTFPFQAGERCAVKTSLNFVDSVWEVFGPLLAGLPIVLIPDDAVKDPVRFVQVLAEQQVTRIVLVPSLLRAILELNDTEITAKLEKLRVWISSGEALTADLVERFHKQLPRAQLLNLYGSTEVAADATFHLVDSASSTPSIGKPIANMRAYILDSHLQPVPVGVVGQLYLGGEGLAHGYWNRPEWTAERFISDPFNPDSAERLYRSGDLARYRFDGNIEYAGRADRQIKIRGNRVELDEVEVVLAEHPGVEQAVVVWRDDKNGDGRLIAHLVPDPLYAAEGETPSSTNNHDHSAWQQVWDEHYRRDNATRDPEFNINGWNSSYTGLPIPEQEMREWVNRTVERISSLKPQRVLEIGCGSGLLLYRIAPQTARYVGADFSPVIFENLSHEISRRNLSQVTLLQRTADDFSGFEAQSFDAVILNSVVQYFDSVEYLVRVLEGATQMLAPGGFIFLGDVRDLRLLDAFHSSVQLHRALGELPLDQLRERVSKRVNHEHELAVHPEFFHDIASHLGLGSCRVELKRVRSRNEMACFRYDVTLQKAVETEKHSISVSWDDDHSDLTQLTRLLENTNEDQFVISGIPNARVRAAVRTADLLKNCNGLRTADDLRAKLESRADDGVDPEGLWRLQAQDWIVQVLHDPNGPPDRINAVFRRRSSEVTSCVPELRSASSLPLPSYGGFANNPRRSISHRVLAAEVRRFLQERLPDYMIPSVLTLRGSLPLLPNGKTDRRALAQAELSRPQLDRSYVGPASQVERTIATVWRDVLQIDRVGIHDNFFDLGGHSLMLVRVHCELRQKIRQKLSVTDLFRYPTIASLAGYLSQGQGPEPRTRTSASSFAKPAVPFPVRPQLQKPGLL